MWSIHVNTAQPSVQTNILCIVVPGDTPVVCGDTPLLIVNYLSFAPNLSSKVFCRRCMMFSICLSFSVFSGS